MAGKKGDGCINLMEERMHSVQEDIIIVKESMMKIPFLEMSMTAIMERLDAMAMEIQENLERLSSNKRRKPKNSNDGFRVGLPKPPLVAEGNRAREVCDNGNKGEIRTRRVEMPNFYGKDPEEWLYCAERFFSLNQMSDTEKLAAVVVSMDGEAFAWHQWEDTSWPFRSWEDFKELLLELFGQGDEEMFEMFFSLAEGYCSYHKDFKRVISIMDNIPECLLEGQFINGP